MITGDPHDMNQESIFDNVESLDLNYFQAATLCDFTFFKNNRMYINRSI